MAQTTVNLQCLGDTYVESSNPNTNYSAQTTLKLAGFPDSIDTFLKFDLSSLPARKRIVSAYLKAYFQGFSSPGSFAVNRMIVRGYDIDINESQITYNNQPTNIQSSGVTYHGTVVTGGVQQSSANSYVSILAAAPLASAYAQNRNNIWIQLQVSYGDNYEQTYTSKESATNKPYLEIIYEDVPPNAPTPTDPIGAYKDNKAAVHFAWQYNSDVGGVQKKFDLQWSTDQVNWTTVSQTTANNYYDMPADTLATGNVYWRVRCYNEYDEASEYCSIQSFYAVGAPTAPAINAIPTNSARPVISWSAFAQQVYQLQVLSDNTVVYDSGIVPGISIRQHKVMAWLADGEYIVRICVKNEYDLWSEWGSATVTISTVKPTKPTLTAAKTLTGIKLTVPSGRMLIYRDGKCIGETATGEYNDNAIANGKEHDYVARAIQQVSDRQIANVLGTDGDCEDISKWTSYAGSLSLDSSNKVFGNSSIKVTQHSGTYATLQKDIFLNIDLAKHYFISAYTRNITTTSLFLRFATNGTGRIIIDSVPSTETSFKRLGIKVSPLNYGIGSTTAIISTIGYGDVSAEHESDGCLVVEITEAEYNSLTVDQLLAKYPFGNNTFMAPAGETFTDSDPVTATAEFKHSLIAPVSDLTDVFTFIRSLNAPPKRTYNRQPGGAFVEYAGRKSPVWEPTEHVSAAWAMAFFLKSWDDVEEFIDIVDRKETVLYRDARGRKIYGVLGNPTVNDEISGYTVGFTLTEVDHIEEVEV